MRECRSQGSVRGALGDQRPYRDRVSLLNGQVAETDSARLRMESRANQLNQAVALELDATLRSVDTALRHLRAVYVHDRRNFDQAVADVLAAYPKGMIDRIIVFGANGHLAFPSGSETRSLPAEGGEQFRVHAGSDRDQLFISPAIVERVSGVPLIQMTRTIRDGKQFLGVIGAPLYPGYLSDSLAKLRVDPADLLAIVRLDGSFIARSHNLEDALKTRVPADRPFLQAQNGERGSFRSASTIDKVPLLFSWQRLTAWPLVVAAAVNEDAELGMINRRQARERQHTLLAAALVLAFALGIAGLLARIQGKNRDLSRSEARYRALFEYSKIPILLIDPQDGVIVDGNAAADAFYGYPRQQLRRMRISDINQLPSDAIKAEMALAESESRDCFHFLHRLASGEIRAVEVRSGPLEIDGRGLLYSFIQDISERRRAEEMLRKLFIAVEQSPASVVITDLDARIQYVNPQFCAVTGYSAEDAIGKNPRVLQSGRMAREVFLELWAALVCGLAWHGELLNKRKDGELYWEDCHIAPVKSPAGAITHYVAVKTDITERKRVDDLLRESEARFRNMADSAPVLIWVSGTDRLCNYFNKVWLDFTGRSLEQELGYGWVEGLHPDDLPRCLDLYANAFDARTGFVVEYRLRRSDGEYRWLLDSGVPRHDEQGGFLGYIGSCIDVTEPKLAAAEVEQHRHHLEALVLSRTA